MTARRRTRLAALLGVAALAVSLIAAVLPARERTLLFAWPGGEIVHDDTAVRLVTPLFLSARAPQRFEVRLPCVLPGTLSGAATGSGIDVLATARYADRADRLSLTLAGGVLTTQAGHRVLARIAWPPRSRAEAGCARVFVFEGYDWALADEGGKRLAGGLTPRFFVSGLFTELDLRRGGGLDVRITASVFGTSPTAAQIALWALAAALAVAALALVGLQRGAARSRPRPRLRRWVRRFDIVDGAVLAALAVWWLFAPAHIDDGWVLAYEREYPATGTFVEYYEALGTPLPLVYWYQWLHHWVATATSVVPLLRLHVLLIGVASWLLCRWLLGRLLEGPTAPRWTVRASMGAIFLLGFMAWGMTLRPEPLIALLAGGVLAAMVAFARSPSAGALVSAGVLVVLAVTAHPAGAVTLAPVVAGAPAIAGWFRGQPARWWWLLGAGGGMSAVLIVLALVDTDITHLFDDMQRFRQFSPGASDSWRDEIDRYAWLDRDWTAIPARRLSVALMLSTVLAYAVRRRVRHLPPIADLASLSLGLGLVALLITPSKRPWHFGTLAVIGAVAIAIEVCRLRAEGRLSRGRWSFRPFLALLALMACAAWAWSSTVRWITLDLRTLDWAPNASDVLPGFDKISLSSLRSWVLVAVDVLLVATIVELLRRGRRDLASVPWRVAGWGVVIVTVPVLVITAGKFIRDTVETPGWTFARQSLRSLSGTQGCGLADEVLVPMLATVRALPLATGTPSAAAPAGTPSASQLPVAGLTAWGPLLSGGAPEELVTPWFALPRDRSVGVFVAGNVTQNRRFELEWGRRAGSSVRRLGSAPYRGGGPIPWGRTSADWRLLVAGDLPRRPADADLVRIRGYDRVPYAGGSIAFTGPVAYNTRTLAAVLREPGRRAVVSPTLLLYLPCARQPSVADGVSEVPSLAVNESGGGLYPLTNWNSPFNGVVDVHGMIQVSVADSPLPVTEVAVFVLDRSRRQGEALLPAVSVPTP